MNTYTLLTYVLNRPGVLNKVSSLLRRKMYNIDTLTVSDTGDPMVSGMTITISSDDPEKVKQMMKQIEKMTEVISITNLDRENSFWREVALIKCGVKRSKIDHIIKNYNAEVIYDADDSNITIIQIAGTPRRIDACMGEITTKNILDISRSGVTAMEIEGVSPDFSYKAGEKEKERVTNF